MADLGTMAQVLTITLLSCPLILLVCELSMFIMIDTNLNFIYFNQLTELTEKQTQYNPTLLNRGKPTITETLKCKFT